MATNQSALFKKSRYSLVSSGPLIPFFLAIWFLIKIGELPIKLFYIIGLVLYLAYREFIWGIFFKKSLNPNFSITYHPKTLSIHRIEAKQKKSPLPRFKLDRLGNIIYLSLHQIGYTIAFPFLLFGKIKPKNIKKVTVDLGYRDTYPVIEYSQIERPTSKNAGFGFLTTLGLSRKKRGRPRTKPLATYYKGRFNKFLNKIFPKPIRIGLALSIIVLFISGYSYFLVNIAHDLPNPEKLSELHEPLTTKFYDRNGKLLYQAYEGRNRTLVKLADVPPALMDATVAIEDKHFYDHPGIDFFAILRAFIANAQDKNIQGGSTLTQQLIKNTLLTPERTYDRKIKEVLLAYWTEKVFTKQQILQMYFNEAPYGGPNWGIAAASDSYFGKSTKDLDLAESAFLAGLPASPTEYSPFGAHPEYAKERQKQVLDRMVEDKYISSKAANDAYSEELHFNSSKTAIKAPHFVMYVRSVLAEKYGEKVVSQGGLNVTTTLDLDAQDMAEKVVSEEVTKLSNLNVTNGAAMITDPESGQILAMVGSKDYYDPKDGNYNVTIANRQPGSSIKPITYATGFKQGYSPGTILLDNPTVFKNAWETYAPVNYDGSYHGAVTIRTALGSSYNIPAVKMLYLESIPSMIQTAKDLGITTFNDPNRYGLSLTLGGGEVKMIDMMTAYGTFSQMGLKHDTTGILKVTDSNGVVLEDNTNAPGTLVLQPGIAYMITSILTDNAARTPAFGPKSLLVIPGHTVAVKTGTTDNKKDNWTFGYTKKYTVGVWVGNNNGDPMDPALTSGVTGAAPIWNRIMSALLEGEPDLAFDRPSDVLDGEADGHKDLVLSTTSQKSVIGYNKKKIKDDQPQQDKEVISFTDPFSTFTSDSTAIIKKQP